MPIFYYRYVGSKGKKQSGRIDALSECDAKEKLRRQGMLVISFHKERPKKKLSLQNKKTEILHGSHLVTFTTQLGQLLNAGIPLYESLISLEEQYRGEKFHPILLSLCDHIKGGSSLSQAMENFPESFNALYRAMITAGESIGALDITLEKLATLLNRQMKLKKQIVSALLYPLVLAAFSFLVIFLLLTFVIPSLQAIFEDRPLNGLTAFLISFSQFLSYHWFWYLPVLFGSIFLFFYFLHTSKGKQWKDRRLLQIPYIRTLVVQASMARFCRTMGTLLQGGVPIISALQISRNVVKNGFLEKIIENAEKKIIEGSFLSCELAKSSAIPPLIPRMLAIGEEGGSSQVMLHKIADLYEDEVEKTLTRITALAQPTILIVMGGVVGFIMMAVLLPLTDINAFLQG
jgi:general secretion pathway protein F